jgi:hypothetical protein
MPNTKEYYTIYQKEMKLQEFLRKNKITLDQKMVKICETGLSKMRHAKDRSHGISHIFHILNNLDYLINSNPTFRAKINFDILLPAICWHDVWISNQNPKNIVKIIYFQMVEGLKSAHLFDEEATKLKLDEYLKRMIKYVIRKHSSFQLLPAFVIEAQVLFDLDKIEMWNYKRFFKLDEGLVTKKEFYQKYIVRFYFTYSEKMGLYFKELEEVFKKNSRKFWKKIS